MDLTTDVVSTTATKIKLDKNFLIGAAAGATVVVGALAVKKVVSKIKAKVEEHETETA